MQLNIKPIVAYVKTLRDGQSVPELRKEVIAMNDETNQNITECEKRLMEQVRLLNERCENL